MFLDFLHRLENLLLCLMSLVSISQVLIARSRDTAGLSSAVTLKIFFSTILHARMSAASGLARRPLCIIVLGTLSASLRCMVNDAPIFAFAVGAVCMVGTFRFFIRCECATDVIGISLTICRDVALFRHTLLARSTIVSPGIVLCSNKSD